jgi:hypothetical protein
MRKQIPRERGISVECLALRGADDGGHRAVIHGLGIGHAPVDVVMHTHAIAGALAFVKVTQAAAAGDFAAAVVVAHQIIFAVLRVLTGADPGDFGHFRARRALTHGSTATVTDKAIQRAVAPIVAGHRIIARGERGVRFATGTIEWQHRQRGAGDHPFSDAGERAASAGELCGLAHAAFRDFVDPILKVFHFLPPSFRLSCFA